MSRAMSQAKIDDLFSDEKFTGQIMEQEWCATTNRNGDRLRLIVVIYPPTDLLHYRVEFGDSGMRLFSKFGNALAAFREML